ncbi:hypothetical protein L2E82_10435 [Cichorium intybus]|uniref:Uncharacterized protein n=1 Tax=Cichorium intybus TaxID=13427 RepID=A0ACB9GAI9_CICIN|nr:hypothetical protein L2E82_10435 [Cichorium intybus]
MGFSILPLLMERVWLTGTSIRDDNLLREYQANLHSYSHPVCDPRHPSHKQWGTSEIKHMSESSVHSPPSPPSPISESIRKHLPNMERLSGLNCKEWLHNWRLVLVIAGKHITEYPIPIPPEQVIIKSLYDKHDFLVDESKKIRDLMLLTIDPEFRRDFESLGPYEFMQLVEERFQKPVEEEQARIFKRLAECKLKKRSSIDSHVLQIEAYIGEFKYDLFTQTYRKEDQKKDFMEMRPLLTLYESLLDRHSSNSSATSGLSPVKRRNKKRSRSSGHVSNWESTESDTITERLEDAPRESVRNCVLMIVEINVIRINSTKGPVGQDFGII